MQTVAICVARRVPQFDRQLQGESMHGDQYKKEVWLDTTTGCWFMKVCLLKIGRTRRMGEHNGCDKGGIPKTGGLVGNSATDNNEVRHQVCSVPAPFCTVLYGNDG